MKYIKEKNVRQLIAKHGKRVSKSFMLTLEIAVEKTIIASCNQHNGGKKTLDGTVFTFSRIGLK